MTSYILSTASILILYIVIFLLALILTFALVTLYLDPGKGVCRCTTRLHGKTALVTGGNVGLGLETARDLARRGARVIIASRNTNKSIEAVDDIIRTSGNENVEYRKLDLSSFESVKKFANDFNSTEPRLDILVNNSGVSGIKKSVTKDGLNNVMQINHFGAFLLTHLLLDKLIKSKPSRIVITSSYGHNFSYFRPRFLTGVNLKVFGFDWFIYANSKLCNILFSRGLAKRLPEGVTANSLHPGIVLTEIFNSVPMGIRHIIHLIVRVCFKNPVEGAQSIIHACVSPELEGVSGVYINNCKIAETSEQAKSNDLADFVWDESMKIVDKFLK